MSDFEQNRQAVRLPLRQCGGGCGQRTDVGGGYGAMGPGLSAVRTDHPNVCYYSGVVWSSSSYANSIRRSPRCF